MNNIRTHTLSLLLACPLTLFSQELITPLKNEADFSLIKDEIFIMNWYLESGSDYQKLGKVKTEIRINGKKVLVITKVDLVNDDSLWVDSTLALLPNLQPVHHSSHNRNRTMIIDYNDILTGFHYNKLSKKNIIIIDSVANDYFDSNIYPTLIRFLPLKQGYVKDIAIYNFDPTGKSGLLKASIRSTEKQNYFSGQSGPRDVWAVKVTDEINETASSIYYIDVNDRKLLKQEISVNGRKMVFTQTEN